MTEHSLYELATFQNGRAFKPAETAATTGVPIIKIAEMNKGISGKTGRFGGEIEPRFAIREGDLLFAWSGSIVIQRYRGPDAALNQHIFKVTAKPGVDQRYMQYLLEAQLDKFNLLVLDQKTTMGHVKVADLKSMRVDVPTLEVQRAIAAVLGALDDKIQSNQEVISSLDELFHARWRALYESEASGREASLGDRVKTQYGLTASATEDPSGVKFLRVTDINKSNWIEWSAVPTVPSAVVAGNKYQLRKGDLLVARMADPGKSALYDDESVPAVFASYLVRLSPRSYEEGLFVFGFLKSKEYADYAAASTTGSVQKNMNAKVIVDTMLRWPSDTALRDFAQEAAPLREALTSLVDENASLVRTRESLLPELLSGRVRPGKAYSA